MGNRTSSPAQTESVVAIPRVFPSSADYRLQVTPHSPVFFEDSRPDSPAGTTVAICLPGIGDTRRQLRLLAPLLHDRLGFRELLGDLRGFGDSAPFEDDDEHNYSAYLPESVASDVTSLMQKISASDPACCFVLLGNSLSLLFRPLYGAAIWASYYKTLYPGKRPEDLDAELGILTTHLRVNKGSILNVGRFARASAWALPVLAFFGMKDPDYADVNAEIRWLTNSQLVERR